MRLLQTLKRAAQAILIAVPALALTLGTPIKAYAAVQNAAPEAKISFTFDDGFASVYNYAAPTLAGYGLKGTSYVVSDCVGMTTAPNTCHADTGVPYMSWEQVQWLQDNFGWEIGSHTATHPYLASSDASDGQPNALTPAQVEQELLQSKADFAAHGISATTMATPYGDYSNAVLAQIAKVYSAHRGFADTNNNYWSYNDLLLNNMPVQEGVSVSQVKSRVDQAIANNEWLILTFHEIRPNPSTNPQDYQYSLTKFQQIAAYVQSKSAQIKNVTVRDGLVESTVNAMPNGNLANGISDGWTTNSPATITADNGNNGSYPESTNAIKLAAGSTNIHLQSPKLPVDSSQTYMLKSFLNVVSRNSGEIGYYIDEYDASGNWVSGQWKKAENSVFVENMNFTYTPTSAQVKKASLQVYVTANSGITAYVDSFEWFSLTGETTPPPAPVTMTNIMPGGTFDGGLTGGWATDNATAFVADGNNNGSPANAAKSIKLKAGTTQAHLFSPRINVLSGTEYSIKSYAHLTSRSSSELGYYIDEYDASGNWVSGKYLGGKASLGVEDLTYTYMPSSTNVKKASVQVILPANSGINGYIDDVQWLAPAGSTTPTEPAPTNLVNGGTFDSGLTGGWNTNNSANVMIDSGNNGSPDNALNSVKMIAAPTNVHLFSPHVNVHSSQTYHLVTYLNMQAITSGELGYYIDEYDASGNWVSGQWKKAESTLGARDVALAYTPSSANVATASLQIYVTPQSGITAFVDNIRWYQD